MNEATRAKEPCFLAGCFINQLASGLLLPTMLVWAMSLLNFDMRGRGTGLWTGAFSIGQFLNPIFVTVVANLQSSPKGNV